MATEKKVKSAKAKRVKAPSVKTKSVITSKAKAVAVETPPLVNPPDKMEHPFEPRQLYQLQLKHINPDPNQPRKVFDPKEIEELAASIVKHGVLQPILFRIDNTNNIFIVSGERRFQASKLAERTEIPAIFTDGTDTAEIALVENLLRVDLTPIEEAEALKRLQDEKNYTNVHLAAVIGKAQSTVSEILKLNLLPAKLRDKHRNDRSLSRRKWLEIAKSDDPKEIKKLYNKLLKNESRDELRAERVPRIREIDAVFKTMIGGLTTKLSVTTFNEIEDVTKRQTIVTELEALKRLIEDKLSEIG